MKPIYHAKISNDITPFEAAHTILARTVGADGMVLLENDGVLPLKEKRVALYGVGARHTTFGGTGSGENNPRYTVTVEEGLKNAGIQIANPKYLDAYDQLYDRSYAHYRKQLAEEMKQVSRMEQMDYAASHPFLPPTPGKIKRLCSTAIYVLTRQAGEGADRREVKGDWYITDGEYAELQAISAAYDSVILLLTRGRSESCDVRLQQGKRRICGYES